MRDREREARERMAGRAAQYNGTRVAARAADPVAVVAAPDADDVIIAYLRTAAEEGRPCPRGIDLVDVLVAAGHMPDDLTYASAVTMMTERLQRLAKEGRIEVMSHGRARRQIRVKVGDDAWSPWTGITVHVVPEPSDELAESAASRAAMLVVPAKRLNPRPLQGGTERLIEGWRQQGMSDLGIRRALGLTQRQARDIGLVCW